MSERQQTTIKGKTVGIIGAGHVGTQVANRLRALGMHVLLCDPPLEHAGDQRAFVSYEKALACDVVTLHTPLISEGQYKTYHLLDKQRLQAIREDQLLINAARGEVVDNEALLALFESGQQLQVVLDVWENEPDIEFRLLPYLALATAHIAGHSIEGKAKGTAFVYQHTANALGLEQKVEWQSLLPENEQEPLAFNDEKLETTEVIKQCVLDVYDIRNDDMSFRQQVTNVETFRYYRKNYPIRREFASTQVKTGNSDATKALYALGFLSCA
jgi:erythronate-4-phosphate dehydrogenase